MLLKAIHSPMVLVCLQALVMIVFLAGAWFKLRARETFEGVVFNYRVLPEFLVAPVSYALPLAELAIGLGLAFAATRLYAGIGVVALLAVFNIAIAINLARGRREIDCGCFSAVLKQRLSGGLILRNIVLMGSAAWLAWSAPQPLIGSTGWLDSAVGLAAALAITFIYMMSATLSAIEGGAAHHFRPAR